MQYSINKVLELRLEDEEITYFIEVLDILKTKAKRTGFNKSFKKTHQDFIDYLHVNILGNEENNDQGQQ